MIFDLSIYRGKRVLVTGHTGFKGSWLCKMLVNLGAIVYGYSLKPSSQPSLFELSGLEKKMNSIIGDITDLKHLQDVFNTIQPEIIFHLAAQPIVKVGYADPVGTYATNVIGTVNLLECVRKSSSVKSVLVVTTDKVYLNREWEWGYRENDELDGYDPYSNSKSCAELVTRTYQRSFFLNNIGIATVRAGNVIGGGDFAKDRIIPDCIRAIINNQPIVLRNPNSIRPYQHVLEPLYAYLMIAGLLCKDISYSGSYNVGPDESDCCQTKYLVELLLSKWGINLELVFQSEVGSHEANCLKLDCSRIKSVFGWSPLWNIEKAIEKVVEWNKIWINKGDVCECMDNEIEEFLTYVSEGE